MSVITDVLLVCNTYDAELALSLKLGGGEGGADRLWQFKEADARKSCGGDKVFTTVVVTASVNYLDRKSMIQKLQDAAWKSPENVLVLVKHEGDVRPAVWGFAGARYFGSVDEPRRLVCLVEAVPS